jgi:hypothetical protein
MSKVMVLMGVALLASATSAKAAEAWTCTYFFDEAPVGNEPSPLVRFEVSPPDLIETKSHQRYPILQNNNYGIVATSSISEIEEGQKDPTVGAATVVINKGTGEFWWGTTIAGMVPLMAREVNKPVHGKCLKD